MEKRARQSSVSRDALPNMREDRASAEELLGVKPGVSGMNENLMVDPVAAIRRMRKELLARVDMCATDKVVGSGGAVHMAPVKPRSYAVVLSDANGVMAKEELKKKIVSEVGPTTDIRVTAIRKCKGMVLLWWRQ
ncbi:hypothetical protein HHI36_016531 [Cryptolaemus montrouzieri]|uniref:Uncharacterized protein n=1 Tax=Cryptolaemus montrouzieri TaxID=559131 RepID=A0ABD2NK18_9CUCU